LTLTFETRQPSIDAAMAENDAARLASFRLLACPPEAQPMTLESEMYAVGWKVEMGEIGGRRAHRVQMAFKVVPRAQTSRGEIGYNHLS
jgi:hypothetical protein